MNVTEFYREAIDAIAAEPDEVNLKELSKQAEKLADMVGWADGVIDKDGQVSKAFILLQEQTRSRHKTTGDENLAILHDALGNLLAAIIRHDDDLRPSTNNDDDNMEM
jgi:hypothetical protein